MDSFKNMTPEVRKLLEALEWCGGSGDFQPGGKAYRGWLSYVAPLLEKYGRRLPTKRKANG